MDSFLGFEDLPTMPPMATVRDSGMLSLSGGMGIVGGGGGQHSPVRGYNPCLVPKPVCPHKELIGEYRDRREVMC